MQWCCRVMSCFEQSAAQREDRYATLGGDVAGGRGAAADDVGADDVVHARREQRAPEGQSLAFSMVPSLLSALATSANSSKVQSPSLLPLGMVISPFAA